MANTSTVAEMASLMTAMRTFEANQKMVQINDERVGRSINRPFAFLGVVFGSSAA